VQIFSAEAGSLNTSLVMKAAIAYEDTTWLKLIYWSTQTN